MKFEDVRESIIVINGIAVVKSVANKCSYKHFGDSKIYISANTTKVANVIKAATTNL